MADANAVEIGRLQEQLRAVQAQQAAHAANTEKLFDKLFNEIDDLKAAMNRGRGVFAASLTFAGILGGGAAALVEYLSWVKK
jgi:hypothetical protein